MKRRTPVRHTVRSHKRGSKKVKTYLRGKGQKPQRSRKVVGEEVGSTEIYGYGTLEDLNSKSKLIERAKDKFGTTQNPDFALYIFPDGRMLDGSGGLHKTPLKFAHWDVPVDIVDIGEEDSGRYSPNVLMHFFEHQTGSIRVIRGSSAEDATLYVDILATTNPTGMQWKTLGRMKPKRGKIVLEVTAPRGEYGESMVKKYKDYRFIGEIKDAFNRYKAEYDAQPKEKLMWELDTAEAEDTYWTEK